jgi:8-oxo-dGTP pyrophosphatase MutT (NUDIX family)
MTVPSTLEAAGFPAAGTIFPVRSWALAVGDGEHPWVVQHHRAIAANWEREIAANPSFFNGRMVFQHRLRFLDGHIDGSAHLAPFAAFLHWRRAERPAGGLHLFAMPLMLSSDGALVAIEMGQKTANPGRVYCAAGSMDGDDIFDGHCDLVHNMRREVLEETGLDLRDASDGGQFFALHDINTVVLFRRYRFAMTAEAMLEAIAAHVAAEAEPEISGAIAIRDARPDRHDYAFFMPAILAWLFES